jgi:large subunit ribosomal protein L25
MTSFAITADIRDTNQKTSEIRKSRKVPGVVYGKTQDPISFTCDSSDFLRLYRKAGESNIITLSVGKLELEVLVHQTQKHPVSGDFTHIDFYAITRGEKLTTKVHFNFIGESEAAKQGAIVEEMMKEIEVTCLPRDLVDHFDIDLGLLAAEGDVIRVSDLKLDGEKYEVSNSDEDAIASASAPKVVVEEEITTEEVVTGSDADTEAKEAAAE